MVRSLLTATLALFISSSAFAADPAPAAWEAGARRSLVEVETVWGWSIGVVVGDGSTVWAFAGDRDAGRGVRVNVPKGPEIDAEATVYRDGKKIIWSLRPERSLDREGVAITTRSPEPGDVVYTLARDGELDFERDPFVKVLVASSGPRSFTLSAEHGELRTGAPVFDRDGRLLGIMVTGRRVVPSSRLGAPENFGERCPTLRGLFGIRAGVELDSALGDSSMEGDVLGLGTDAATIFDIELGLVIWDRLALVTSFGVAIGETDDTLLRLPEEDGLGPAVVSMSRGTAYRVALEARYRQLIRNSETPVYIDIAAGGLYSSEDHDPVGAQLRSTDPGCDPTVDACPLVAEERGDIDTDRYVDMRVGLDVRIGALLLGYRFLPGFGDAAQVHQLTIGLTGP